MSLNIITCSVHVVYKRYVNSINPYVENIYWVYSIAPLIERKLSVPSELRLSREISRNNVSGYNLYTDCPTGSALHVHN